MATCIIQIVVNIYKCLMKISRHSDHACVMNLECLNSVYCIGIILKTAT